LTETLRVHPGTIPPEAMAADAAELLSLRHGLDYRSAYKQIGREVADGHPPDLDPAEAIATRTVPGGAAPAPMDAMLAETRATIAAARSRTTAARERIARAEAALVQLAGSRSSVS
jgi:argininosuccinate lyase